MNQENLDYDVAVFSAFGRGNWMATELANRGFKVQLFDVTTSLGRWAPEDWEGPFGFFQSNELSESQLLHLQQESYVDPVRRGFSLWPAEGPMDFRGPLISYHLETIEALKIAKKYLPENPLTLKEKEALKDQLFGMDYQQTWVVQFAHQLAATRYQNNAVAMNFGDPLPLGSPFALRRVSRKSLQVALENCQKQGVETYSEVKIEDVSIASRDCVGVQISGPISRVVKAKNYVWCLSGAETKTLSISASLHLYPRGILSAQWNWMRWRIQGNDERYKEVLPLHWVMIGDVNLSWTHDNLLIVQRCEVSSLFDVWCRVPVSCRFQRNYLESLAQKIENFVNQRIPQFQARVQNQPQDYHYNEEDLGPPLFPVFDSHQWLNWSALPLKNFFHDGVEWIKNMDWTGRMLNQTNIIDVLLKKQMLPLKKTSMQIEV
ncbi:MAG: hypothetical protein K1X29_01790 [Bdellovibrionales bacterium]|nr:hypothetical protein [Bdellovibrionales bacterium]